MIAGFAIEDDPPPPVKPARAPKSDSTTVTLRGVRVPLSSDVGSAFISDCARNRERIFSDAKSKKNTTSTPTIGTTSLKTNH